MVYNKRTQPQVLKKFKKIYSSNLLSRVVRMHRPGVFGGPAGVLYMCGVDPDQPPDIDNPHTSSVIKNIILRYDQMK